MMEVIVSFMVLLIVLALFTGAINFASSAQMRSIDARRESDNEYKQLRETINAENQSGEHGDRSDSGLSDPATVSVTASDGTTQITLNAYKYTSGDSVFWVFR